MQDLKFRVKNAEHSTAIQERVFELGPEWHHDGKKVLHLNKPFLYVYFKGKCINYGEVGDNFLAHQSKEATLDDLYNLAPQKTDLEIKLEKLEATTKEMLAEIKKLKEAGNE